MVRAVADLACALACVAVHVASSCHPWSQSPPRWPMYPSRNASASRSRRRSSFHLRLSATAVVRCSTRRSACARSSLHFLPASSRSPARPHRSMCASSVTRRRWSTTGVSTLTSSRAASRRSQSRPTPRCSRWRRRSRSAGSAPRSTTTCRHRPQTARACSPTPASSCRITCSAFTNIPTTTLPL